MTIPKYRETSTLDFATDPVQATVHGAVKKADLVPGSGSATISYSAEHYFVAPEARINLHENLAVPTPNNAEELV
jgi:di/tripeptidase